MCNDGWMLVAFINALGEWTLRPGGYSYGDLWGRGEHTGAGKHREVTHWMPLPKPPEE